MSKITINAVLTVLRLVVTLTTKCIRLLYSISDLVDDGCINASVARPDWMITLNSVLSTFETMISHLGRVEEDVYTEVK